MCNHPFLKIDDSYYVRHEAAVESGVKGETLYGRSKRKADKWGVTKDPNNGNANLYRWDCLTDDDREKISAHWKSEPAEYLAIEPIRKMIVKDLKAEAFYLEHTYLKNGEPEHLTKEQVQEYTRNASLLNMLLEVYKDGNSKKVVKKKWGMGLMDWVEQVMKLVAQDKYKLPGRYENLISRNDSVLKKYKEGGYALLIHGHMGGQNATKVKDAGKDMLFRLLKDPHQFDDKYICMAYNDWAKSNSHKEIDPSTVKRWRKEFEHLIKAEREGWGAFNKKYSRSVQRQAPTQPTYLIEGDDNHLDWWFRDDKTGDIRRVKVYVVVDSYKNVPYVLGWAFNEDAVTVETVKLAYLSAFRHICELTGGWYLPHQVKVDAGFSSEQMEAYYEGISKDFHWAGHKSVNRGYIESFFGHTDWHRSLKLDVNGLPNANYTGHNVTAETEGVNREHLNMMFRGKMLPPFSEAEAWVSAHMNRLRHLPIGFDKKNQTRQEVWLEGWASMPEESKVPITKLQYLQKAGFVHEENGGNKITKAGVQPTIMGAKYSYAVPPAFYLQNVGRKVITHYDPFDMGEVLITDNEKLRFIAKHITPVASCLADMKEGGRALLNKILEEKKADVQKVVATSKKEKMNLALKGHDPDRVLAAVGDPEKMAAMAGMLPKKLLNDATETWQQPEVTETKIIPFNQEQTESDIMDDAIVNI